MKREIAGKLMLCLATAVIIAAVDLAAVNHLVQMKIRPVMVPVNKSNSNRKQVK